MSTHRSEIENRVAIMQAWLAGETIEVTDGYSNPPEWIEIEEDATPDFYFNIFRYRVKPVNVPKDSIDWSHVHPDFNYMARDSNGDVYLYEEKPYTKDTYRQWTTFDGKTECCNVFASLRIDENCHWRNSLVERPVSE